MNMKKTAALILAMLMMTTALSAFAETGTTVSLTPVAEEAQAETEGTEDAAPAEEQAAPEADGAEPAEGTVPAEEAAPVAAESVATESVTALDDQKLDAAYTLVLNAINKEDYETAKEYIEICFAYVDVQTNPVMYSDLLLKRACINVIEEKTDIALLSLDAALRVNPDLADAYLVRTQIYAGLGDADKAIANLEKYIELTQDTSLYETVAQLQEARGDIAAAQAAYDKYVAGAGGDVTEAGFQAGLYRMESGRLEEAIEAFKPYLDDETFGAGAAYNIGICQMNLPDYAAAVESFTVCEEKGGTFEGLYYNRGICQLLCENYAAAAEDFAKSIEVEPYKEDARYNLAICRMQAGDYAAAEAAFTDCIGDGETGSEETADGAEQADRVVNDGAYYYRAVCRTALGNAEGALADYTVCIDHGYELAQCYYQRAQIYEALGDTEKQSEDLAQSLKYAD